MDEKCIYCNSGERLVEKEVPYTIWGYEAGTEVLMVAIDRGYLRLVSDDDMQCLDHGEKIAVNYCPECGRQLREQPLTKEDLGEDLCEHCPLPGESRGVQCYGGAVIMCEGSHCDEAYERYIEDFVGELLD